MSEDPNPGICPPAGYRFSIPTDDLAECKDSLLVYRGYSGDWIELDETNHTDFSPYFLYAVPLDTENPPPKPVYPTPGPWEVGTRRPYIVAAVSEPGSAVFRPRKHLVSAGEPTGGSGWPAGVGSITPEQISANGRAISKIPEMLRLLRWLAELDWTLGYELSNEQLCEFNDSIADAQQYISEITGETEFYAQ